MKAVGALVMIFQVLTILRARDYHDFVEYFQVAAPGRVFADAAGINGARARDGVMLFAGDEKALVALARRV